MPSRRKSNRETVPVLVSDYLSPSSIIISRDLIVSTEGTISCIHLCDELAIIGDNSDPIWPQINICIETTRRLDKKVKEFNAANLVLKVSLRNPAGATFDITEQKVDSLKDDNSWTVTRLVLPLSGYLGFKGPGNYYFEVLGKSGNGDYQLLLSRLLRVKRITESSTD